MVSGEVLFLFQKLHDSNNIQYVVVTQNVNTILYGCIIIVLALSDNLVHNRVLVIVHFLKHFLR